MEFSWEISFGQIVNGVTSAIVFLAGLYALAMRMYHAIDKRVTKLEDALLQHAGRMEKIERALANTVEDHGNRMDRYEAQFVRVVGDLQRVIGGMEVFQNMRNRRSTD